MKQHFHLPLAADLIIFLAIAIGCAVAFFRASDIVKHNIKINRESGWEFFAKAHERPGNIAILKAVFLIGFMMSCYAIYDDVAQLL